MNYAKPYLALLAGLALCLSTACNNEELVELNDTGTLCYNASLGTEAQPVVAGEPVSISIQVGTGGCTEFVEGSCTAELQNGQIVVQSNATALKDTSTDECTAELKINELHCETPPLDEGEYVIRFGANDTATVTVPSDMGTCPY